MGDVAKFIDPYLTPDAELIINRLKQEFRCQITFVSQYKTKKLPRYLKKCKILPHSTEIDKQIAKHRLYLHANRFCTFEMMPVEAMSSGTPVCYIDMPQSLNSYIGQAGLKFDNIEEMLWSVRKIYNSEDTWKALNRAGLAKGGSFGYTESAVNLAKTIETVIRRGG